MNWANPALWVAVGGCITALTSLVGLIIHVKSGTDTPAPPKPPAPLA